MTHLVGREVTLKSTRARGWVSELTEEGLLVGVYANLDGDHLELSRSELVVHRDADAAERHVCLDLLGVDGRPCLSLRLAAQDPEAQAAADALGVGIEEFCALLFAELSVLQ